MKIKQLSVHTRPILELCGHRVLIKGLIIGQPNMAAEMPMGTEETIIEEKLRLGFFNLQVRRQQINVLADHNLRNKIWQDWRNARSNNERLVSHDQSRRWRHTRHSYGTRNARRSAKGTGRASR